VLVTQVGGTLSKLHLMRAFISITSEQTVVEGEPHRWFPAEDCVPEVPELAAQPAVGALLRLAAVLSGCQWSS